MPTSPSRQVSIRPPALVRAYVVAFLVFWVGAVVWTTMIRPSHAAPSDAANPDRLTAALNVIATTDRVALDRHGTGSAGAGLPTADGSIRVYLNCDGHGRGTVHVVPSNPKGYGNSLTLPCGTVPDESSRMAEISGLTRSPATISVTVPAHTRWHLLIIQDNPNVVRQPDKAWSYL